MTILDQLAVQILREFGISSIFPRDFGICYFINWSITWENWLWMIRLWSKMKKRVCSKKNWLLYLSTNLGLLEWYIVVEEDKMGKQNPWWLMMQQLRSDDRKTLNMYASTSIKGTKVTFNHIDEYDDSESENETEETSSSQLSQSVHVQW
jgi:hypothetical protein